MFKGSKSDFAEGHSGKQCDVFYSNCATEHYYKQYKIRELGMKSSNTPLSRLRLLLYRNSGRRGILLYVYAHLLNPRTPCIGFNERNTVYASPDSDLNPWIDRFIDKHIIVSLTRTN